MIEMQCCGQGSMNPNSTISCSVAAKTRRQIYMEHIGVVHMVRSNKYEFLETAQTAWMYKDNLDI